jgi:hypothetical protein
MLIYARIPSVSSENISSMDVCFISGRLSLQAGLSIAHYLRSHSFSLLSCFTSDLKFEPFNMASHSNTSTSTSVVHEASTARVLDKAAEGQTLRKLDLEVLLIL